MNPFLDTLAGQTAEHTPIWLMRQAGRYLPEYRALKERYAFWQLVRTPELAAEVTLQPLRRFELDAAILFQDIMTPLPAMGVELDFEPGPVIARPVRSASAAAALRVPHPEEIAPFAAEAIRMVRKSTATPLIGFAGAPLTLAAYLVEGSGSKDFATFRAFLHREPATLHTLLDKLTQTGIAYLKTQVEAGAQAIQLFDSWAGLHDERAFREFGLPYVKRTFDALGGLGVPRIYLAVAAGHLYPAIAELACEAISIDWRTPLSVVRGQLPGKVLQGNLDPSALLAPRARLLEAADRVLAEGAGGPHVFNLGHGVMPQTDPDSVQVLVDHVHSYQRDQRPHGQTAEQATVAS